MFNEELVVCPKCKQELEYQADEKDNEKNNDKGKLICYHCKLIYMVERNIAYMLIDQAKSFGEK